MEEERAKMHFEAVEAWIKNQNRGTLILPTGVGKTFIASTIINAQMKKGKIESALVVVPTLNLIEQWKREFKKWKYSLDGVEFLCIKSAYKIEKSYDLLVIDEIHTALSKEHRAVFSNIKYLQILGLTATVPRDEEYQTVLGMFCPIVFTRSVKDVAGTITADYRIFNLPVKLSQKDQYKYRAFTGQFNLARMELSILKKEMEHLKFLSVFDIAQKYSVIKDGSLLAKHSKDFWAAMSLRKWVCYNSLSKIQVVKDIIRLFSKEKWIIFNKSVAFAEALSAQIPNSRTYHYKTENREQVLLDFVNDEFPILIAVDALNTGLNVPAIKYAICVSGVSTELIQVQSLGRITRKVGDDIAVFFNLYSEGTVEENWVKEKTSKLEHVYWLKDLTNVQTIIHTKK